MHISPDQAQEVAQAVQEATARPPDQVVQTGAQLQIVTDPAKPDQKPDKPPISRST